MADQTVAWAPGSTDPKIAFAEFKLHLREITPRIRVVPVVVALNVLVFGAMVATGISPLSPSSEGVLHWGADYAPLTLGGQPWRLLTSVFVHVGIIHLAANMLALLDAGPIIERLFGSLAFAALYLAAGITGSVASIAVHPDTISAGASGAIFGIYGALGAVMLLRRKTIPPLAFRRLGGVAATFIIYNFSYAIGRNGIDSMAHLGGLFGGAIAGACLVRPLVPDRPGSHRRSALVAAGSLAVGLAAVLLVPPPPVDFVQAFAARQRAALASYNSLLRQLNGHEITSLDAANKLNDDILPSWRTTRATLERESERTLRQGEANDKQQQLLALLAEEAVVLERGWERMVPALRAHDDAGTIEAARDMNASLLQITKKLDDLTSK